MRTRLIVALTPVYECHHCPEDVVVKHTEIYQRHGHYFRGEISVHGLGDRSFEFIEFQLAMQAEFRDILQHMIASCEMYAAEVARRAATGLRERKIQFEGVDAMVWENDVVGAGCYLDAKESSDANN